MVRNKSYTITKLITSILFIIMSVNLTATSRGKRIETMIHRGVYIPQDLLTRRSVMHLPIPESNEDYAFMQSIRTVTNVIIGSFASGEKKITWIQDTDADGTVDSILYFYPELGKVKEDASPAETVSAEKFEEMKRDIIMGKQDQLAPNQEAVLPLKRLIEKNSEIINVQKTKNGYSVRIPDVDNRSRIRITFMYSNNRVHGYDMVFEVIYRNVGETLVAPVIRHSVYCSNSVDPVVKEYAQELLEHTAEYYPYE